MCVDLPLDGKQWKIRIGLPGRRGSWAAGLLLAKPSLLFLKGIFVWKVYKDNNYSGMMCFLMQL